MMEPTAYNRLFYRLKVQALIKDLRTKFGDDQAFDIIAHAIRLENQHAQSTDDRRDHDHA